MRKLCLLLMVCVLAAGCEEPLAPPPPPLPSPAPPPPPKPKPKRP